MTQVSQGQVHQVGEGEVHQVGYEHRPQVGQGWMSVRPGTRASGRLGIGVTVTRTGALR